MSRIIAWLTAALRTPSSFPAQPWAYARNQFGHGYIVGGLPAALWPPAFVIVLFGYMVWEAVQILRYGSRISDSLDDYANVMTVALAAALHEPALLIVHALYLASGVMGRLEDGASTNGEL